MFVAACVAQREEVCVYCELRFTRADVKRTHELLHTGERPYVCDHPGCGMACADPSNLRAHKRTHLANRVRFACDFVGCNLTYLHNCHLLAHKRAQGH